MRSYEFLTENFADGKKPGRKGLAKRSGVNTKASVSDLRKTAKHSTGEKARMAHWLANMKAGRAKNEDIEEGWKDWVAGAALGAAALGSANAAIVKHIAEPGDTVYSIARQNNVAPTEILKLNKFTKDTKLKPGQAVKVPDNAKPIKQTSTKKVTTPQTKAAEPVKVAEPSAKVSPSQAEQTLQKTAKAAGINGVELAQFLAQTKHESADFAHMKEIGGSLDFKKYDPKFAPRKAKTLGNVKPGDGERYKGRGFIQLTGRDNYRMAGAALGLPLEQHPEMAGNLTVAAKVAVWYWNTRVKPSVNNFNDTTAVTKKINPALRGLEDRHENFLDYKKMLAMK